MAQSMARILVIDDTEEVRSYLRIVLERAGHNVVEAMDGNRGIQLFKQESADLVFCDLYMPEKEGLSTIRELRQEKPDIKIIAMSGGDPRTQVDFLPLAAKLGAVKTLSKPFGREEILQA